MFASAIQIFNSPYQQKQTFPAYILKYFIYAEYSIFQNHWKKWENKTEKFTPIQTVKIRSRKSNSNFSVPHINHFEERPICHNNADKHKKKKKTLRDSCMGEKWREDDRIKVMTKIEKTAYHFQ